MQFNPILKKTNKETLHRKRGEDGGRERFFVKHRPSLPLLLFCPSRPLSPLLLFVPPPLLPFSPFFFFVPTPVPSPPSAFLSPPPPLPLPPYSPLLLITFKSPPPPPSGKISNLLERRVNMFRLFSRGILAKHVYVRAGHSRVFLHHWAIGAWTDGWQRARWPEEKVVRILAL